MLPYISLYNGNKMDIMIVDMINLSHSSSNYAWLLIAFDFILDPFSNHNIVLLPFLSLSLNFSQKGAGDLGLAKHLWLSFVHF